MVDFSQARITMVDTQVRPSDVSSFPVIEAMLEVPRENFVPASLKPVAYAEEQIRLSDDRIMLDPRTLAKILDFLDPQSDEVALDVGCGLGYSTALIARMAHAAIGVEDDAARVAEAQGNLSAIGADNAAIVEGQLSLGAAKQGPYDLIVITGGGVEQIPASLTDQLREGGRIGALFMDGKLGIVRIGHRREDTIVWRDAFNATAPVLVGFTRPRGFTL